MSATSGVPLQRERVFGRHIFHKDVVDLAGEVRPLLHTIGIIAVFVARPEVDVSARKGSLYRVWPDRSCARRHLRLY